MSVPEPSPRVVSTCPLCGERSGVARDSLEYDRIWKLLQETWGIAFSDDLVARHTPAPATSLRECAGCGLQYFAPSVSGDASFYERLMRAVDYETERWEFAQVGARLRPDQAVLDVGCGEGAFLGQIRGSVRRAAGLDHNRDAIAKLNDQGIEAYALPLSEFAREHARRFDVVCAFQIIEHLGTVDELVRPALQCLRRGGTLFLSVPNRNRYRTHANEPFDMPPHHISRWEGQQFQVLAERFRVRLADLTRQPPDYSVFQQLSFERSLRVSSFLGARMSRIAARVHRRLWVTPKRYERMVASGQFASRGVFGHTMLAELRL